LYAPTFDSSSTEGGPEAAEERKKRIALYCESERWAMDAEVETSVGRGGRGGMKRHGSMADITLFGHNSPPSQMIAQLKSKPNELHQRILMGMGFSGRVVEHALQIEMSHMERIDHLSNDVESPELVKMAGVSKAWLFDVMKKT
jgi:hypothetical protein